LLITIIRTIIVYFFVVLTIRMMGKRQIGELEASELVVTIIISEIAATPITNIDAPLATNVLAIFILMILEVVMSYLAFRMPKVREILYGRPSVFYKNGKLNQKEMLSQRFNVADVMEEVRSHGACSLSDVEYIVMETNGNVSVILKNESSPVTAKQLNIKTDTVRMSYIIIDNGNIIKECMDKLGLNEKWLKNKLEEHNIKRPEDVFYLSFEQMTGKTVVIPKEKRRKGS